MHPASMRVSELPVKNPVCVHEWQLLSNQFAFECKHCGYVVTMRELHQPHEGELNG
jgi:hypothetical protein